MSKLHFIQSINILIYKVVYIDCRQIYLTKNLQLQQTNSITNNATETQVSRLITMNNAFTKSMCVPWGTGSGMVIPVSSLCCCKTEGLWCLFLLFLPALLFKALLALKSPTPLSERGAQKTLTTPLMSSEKRGTQCERTTSGRDRRVRWWWGGSITFNMRLMDWRNLVSWRSREYKMTDPFLALSLVPCDVL